MDSQATKPNPVCVLQHFDNNVIIDIFVNSTHAIEAVKDMYKYDLFTYTVHGSLMTVKITNKLVEHKYLLYVYTPKKVRPE